MRKLFISPHPDDVELACGGTIARSVESMHDVHIAVMVGAGDLKMVHSAKTISFDQRKEEQLNSAKVLGVREVLFLGVGKAAHLDTVPLSVGVCKLDKLLAEGGYSELYIPYPNFNQDHQYTWHACMAALRPTKADKLTVYVYEQATQWHGQQFGQALTSRHYVQLSDQHQKRKEQALMCHKSQVQGRVKQMLREVRSLSALRGLEAGVDNAEMFHLLRRVVLL